MLSLHNSWLPRTDANDNEGDSCKTKHEYSQHLFLWLLHMLLELRRIYLLLQDSLRFGKDRIETQRVQANLIPPVLYLVR